MVTGAGRGMGKGIARALAEQGATLYITGRDEAALAQTVAEIEALGGRGQALLCDHTGASAVQSAVAQVEAEAGRLDVLVNNAWGGYVGYEEAPFEAPFWEQPLWRWDGMFTAGVRASLLTSYYAAPLFLRQKSGLIVNISAGDAGQYLGNLLYDVAKNAIDRMTRGMARELKAQGVAVLAVYPGFTRTEAVLKTLAAQGALDALAQTESPLYTGRAVAHLAADAAIMDKTGRAFRTGDLAREYGFLDEDGRQPEAFRLPAEYNWE